MAKNQASWSSHLPAKTTNPISGGLGVPKQEGEVRDSGGRSERECLQPQEARKIFPLSDSGWLETSGIPNAMYLDSLQKAQEKNSVHNI